MKVLLFGATGQVGQALLAQADARVRFDVVGRDRADLAGPATCAALVRDTTADVVVNAAAWTGVDAAEDAEDAVMTINAEAPIAMAGACAERGLPFVHLSSDYVLDGQGRAPQSEDTPLNPLSVYGRSKAVAETGIAKAMQASGTGFAILRTSWVFSDTGANFVRTMVRLSDTRNALDVVGDQVGGPTSARSIAQACLTVGRALTEGRSTGGVYNFAGAPDVSWADFACAIFDIAGRSVTVTPIGTKDYPTRAARPANSRLECRRIEEEFGITRPQWRDDLAVVVPVFTMTP